jgi:F-type H+-transporting ATPase subunit b
VDITITLVGQMITFLLFVWFTRAFVWPPVIKALKDRQAKIADGLAAAERGQAELLRAQEQVALDIKEGKQKASNFIVEAQKQADILIDEARQKAHEEGQRIIQQAHAEIDQMVKDAKESLRKQVASLALIGAEKILERSIDENSHHAMLEKFAEEI